MIKLGLIDAAGVDSVRAQAQAAMTAAVGALSKPTPRTPTSAASVPSCGPTPASSTSASAATARELDGLTVADPLETTGGTARHQVRRCRRRRHGPPHGDGPPHRRARRGRAPPQRRNERRDQGPRQEVRRRTGCSAPRSARTPSPGSPAGWRSTAASVRWSSSCTPTSCGSPPTRSSTRSARRGTCSAATTPCRSCCAPRSRWVRATARST